MPRIISGEFRRRLLAAPPDAEVTRPYPDRVKESIFNLLRGWFEDARVLDLFCGVGTVGLEAASRGAAEVVMVERDRRIAKLLRENIAMLGCGDRVRVVEADALGETSLNAAPTPMDIVFVDPPYPMMRDADSFSRVMAHVKRIGPLMKPKSFLVLRTPHDKPEEDFVIEGFDGPEVRRFGPEMYVCLYQPTAPVALTSPPPSDA